ncbi:MAG: hypothetical protein H6Q72_2874 [Firmicutes bacterium]|nr:hypothetical protein [Bacillota bacterium]
MHKAKLISILTVIILLFMQTAFANDYVFSGNQPEGPKYKGLSTDWWASWYLQEFDKYAPAPGSDWTEHVAYPAKVREWLDKAMKKGWVINTIATQPKVGAIAIQVNHADNYANLYIVREILEDGVRIAVLTKKGVKERNISFNELSGVKNGYIFKGYIYPEKAE